MIKSFDNVDDFYLVEVWDLWERRNVELVPQINLVLYVLKNVARDFMLGDSDDVLFLVEAPLLNDPDALIPSPLDIWYFSEMLKAHFSWLVLFFGSLVKVVFEKGVL